MSKKKSDNADCLQQLVKPLPRNVADARIEALEEAAGHLDLTWTEDDEEKIQGHEVSHQLRKMAQQIFELRLNEKADLPTPGE